MNIFDRPDLINPNDHLSFAPLPALPTSHYHLKITAPNGTPKLSALTTIEADGYHIVYLNDYDNPELAAHTFDTIKANTGRPFIYS